jgi:hypothetical protein
VVGDQDRVGDGVEAAAAPDRDQVGQAEPEHTPYQHQRRDHGQERGQVQAPERVDVQVVQQVGHERGQHRHDQHHALPAVDVRDAPQVADEDDRAGPDEGVPVDDVGPEEHAVGGDGVALDGGAGRVVPDQVVGGAVGQQDQHDQGFDGQQDQQAPARPAPGVGQHERQPGRRQGRDPQVLEIAPELLGVDVTAVQLEGVAHAPYDAGQEQEPERHRRHARPPAPDVGEGSGQDDSANQQQCPRAGQAPRHRDGTSRHQIGEARAASGPRRTVSEGCQYPMSGRIGRFSRSRR